MATYVNDLRLKEIATGGESGTWGTSTNTNLELIGEALSYGTQESFSSDADATTTIADGATDPARCFYFKVTSSGSLTATRTLTMAPNTVSRIQIIENATSGSQIITISQGSGASVNIPNGETRMVYMDGAGAGAAVVDALADINIGGKVTVGVDDTGYDVKLFGATSGKYWLWDESADGVLQYSSLTVGVDDTGYDVKFFGATSGAYMLWDESADDLKLVGAAGLTVAGDIDIDGTANLDVVDIDGATQADGTITVGVDDTGYDVKFFGATSGAYMLWDESADDLKLVGAAGLTVAGDADIDGTLETDNLTIGDSQGSDGQVLTSTGSGVGWEDASGASDIDGLSDALVEDNSVYLGNDPSGTTSTASYNVAVGTTAMDAITTADRNVAVGYNAATAVTTGIYVTAIGSNALEASTTQHNNTAVGTYAGYACTGAENTFIGSEAGHYATSCDKSVVIGYTAVGLGVMTGNENTIIGQDAGMDLTSGYSNTFIGSGAGANVTTGYKNIAVGDGALVTGTDMDFNIAIGYSALANGSVSGDHNIAIGLEAGDAMSSGEENVAIGSYALNANTTENDSTAVGDSALLLSTARSNTAVGSRAGDSVTDQPFNAYFGFNAGGNSTGGSNVFVGAGAGGASGSANSANVIIGLDAGYQLGASGGAASHNTLIGYHAGLLHNGNCATNTCLGSAAGDEITTGSNNTLIGYRAGTADSPSGSITTGDNIVCFGDTGVTAAYVEIDAWTTSDERDKADQTNFSGGLDWVNAMQPITYYWDKRAAYCSATDPTLKITTSVADTFTVNETVKGQTSNSYGIFKSGSGDTLTFDNAAGAFEAGETVIGETSEIEATVAASDFFDNGQITSADVLAATPDGTHKGTSIQIGFSAQDILDIEQAHGYGSDNDDSLMVDLTEDETRYSLRKTSLIPILVNAIKDLSTENDALEARIEALENA